MAFGDCLLSASLLSQVRIYQLPAENQINFIFYFSTLLKQGFRVFNVAVVK